MAATKHTVIATGILNLWMHEPSEVAARYATLTETHGERFLLGIGVSHAPLIDSKEPGRYRKPLAATKAFLDGHRQLAAAGSAGQPRAGRARTEDVAAVRDRARGVRIRT